MKINWTKEEWKSFIKISQLDGYIKLPKVDKVKTRVHRELDGKILSATVKRETNRNYYVVSNLSLFKFIQVWNCRSF